MISVDNDMKRFLFNKENILNCAECPYNIGSSDWQNRKPCGQQNCWVELHTRETEQKG